MAGIINHRMKQRLSKRATSFKIVREAAVSKKKKIKTKGIFCPRLPPEQSSAICKGSKSCVYGKFSPSENKARNLKTGHQF